MRQIRNQAAALASLALLASCSNDDSQSTTDVGPSTSTTRDPGYIIIGETQLYGPGRWAMPPEGNPAAPLAVIDVPAGYQGHDGFVWTHDELDLDDYPGQLLYGAPTRVFTDPCDVDRPSPRMGPAIEDLAEALVAQKRTKTTRPVPAELGGYRGLYLELTTPEDMCSRDERVVRRDETADDMIILEYGPDGERPLEVPATERYWILDIEGRRVVVSAMTPAGARSESVKRVTDVAEAITFVEAP